MDTESEEGRQVAGKPLAAPVEMSEASGIGDSSVTKTDATISPRAPSKSRQSMSSLPECILADMRRDMAANGLVFKGDIEADREIHRAHGEGDKQGSKNGWYKLPSRHPSRPMGSMGATSALETGPSNGL